MLGGRGRPKHIANRLVFMTCSKVLNITFSECSIGLGVNLVMATVVRFVCGDLA